MSSPLVSSIMPAGDVLLMLVELEDRAIGSAVKRIKALVSADFYLERGRMKYIQGHFWVFLFT